MTTDGAHSGWTGCPTHTWGASWAPDRGRDPAGTRRSGADIQRLRCCTYDARNDIRGPLGRESRRSARFDGLSCKQAVRGSSPLASSPPEQRFKASELQVCRSTPRRPSVHESTQSDQRRHPCCRYVASLPARAAANSVNQAIALSRESIRRPSGRIVTSSGVDGDAWRRASANPSAVITGCADITSCCPPPERFPSVACAHCYCDKEGRSAGHPGGAGGAGGADAGLPAGGGAAVRLVRAAHRRGARAPAV